MRIRDEHDTDHAAVRQVQTAAFGDGRHVADLVDALRHLITGQDGLSLVAELDDQVIGHVMFTRALLDAPRRLVPVQVLSPLGVRPDQQRRGVGGALVRAGLERSAARGVPLVFLEGSPAYYPRLGFRPGAELDFRRPSRRIPPAAFQVYPLAAYRPWMTGTLVYPQVFWDFDAVGLRD